MAKLNLKSVTYNLQRRYPSYIVSAIVDSTYGYDGVKLISSPEELDKYYQGIKNREGLLRVLNAGSSLLLTRLDRKDTRRSTLRVLENNFRYCHPPEYDRVDYESQESVDFLLDSDKVSLHKTHTYSYKIDFSLSTMEDEDYIAIPSFFNGNDPEYDNSILIYFTELNPVDFRDRKFPNDFTPSVPLSTLGSKSLAIDIENVDENDRAKIIYEWFIGSLELDETKYHMVGTPGDSNIVPELCDLDEESNSVTLVFKKPIRNIHYFNSNSTLPFDVSSQIYLNQELITRSSIEDSVVSFETKMVGDINMGISLKHVRDYHFELEINSSEENEYHYVSLDIDEPLYQGRSIFIEDVIGRDSNLVNCSVHLGGRIYSELSDQFTVEKAKSIEGDYILSYGKVGENIPEYIDGILEYPFQRSLNSLMESDILPNIFMFEESISPAFQEECSTKFLIPNSIVGLVNIPETLIEEGDIEEYLLEDSKRELILYTYGRSTINDTLVDNSYLYSLNAITGQFKNSIIEGAIPEDIESNVLSILDSHHINYLEKTQEYHFINKIINVEGFVDPHYILVTNYVTVYMTRFLKSKLGIFPKDLLRMIQVELSKLSEYSNLIDSLGVSDYTYENNNLNLNLNLNLSGLIGRSIDVVIQINKD